VRILPEISYWSSQMRRSDVRELEERLEDLVDREAPPGSTPATVSLGQIDWSDLVLTVDGQYVRRIGSLLTYIGAGASAHLMNGGGELVADTFIEDLLDTVTAGANLHLGVEYPLTDWFRIYGDTRYEVAEPLQYFELRVGGQLMISSPVPSETRPPS
jgi:hypothetical protein